MVYIAVHVIERTESDSSGADSIKLIPADFNNTESGAVCVSRRRLPVELFAVRSGDPVILYDDVEDLWLLSAVRWVDDRKILVDPFMRVAVRCGYLTREKQITVPRGYRYLLVLMPCG